MKQICKFDPQRDVMAVDPSGYADLVKANQTNSIDGLAQATEGRSNGIEDPRSIGTRPDDVFEAMQAQKAAAGYVPEAETS